MFADIPLAKESDLTVKSENGLQCKVAGYRKAMDGVIRHNQSLKSLPLSVTENL